MNDQPLILDRYRPLAELGRGSNGHVVLAYDTRMARRVAIKILPIDAVQAQRLGSPDGLAEARTSALLNHPNIVTVHDWDADGSNAYLVMEAVDGASLADLVDRAGIPLDPAQVSAVVADVAEALGFAHHNGVLHLDVKPENVLITRDGLAKVADFGVARLTDVAGSALGMAGTPGFMAPEQLRGEPLDERVDVWSLGALAYLMLTGREPHPARTHGDALASIEAAEPPAPSRIDRDLPPELDDVVFVALAVDPDDRQPTTRAFADELLALLPDPARGREELASDVAQLLEDEEEPISTSTESGAGLWDAVASYGWLIGRVAAAAASFALAWAGFSGLPLSWPVAFGAATLVAVGAAAAPGLGLGLAFIALVLGTVVQVGWLLGLVVAAALAGLWWVGGRSGDSAVLAGLYGPPLGMLRLGALAPPLFGFFLDPLRAAAAAALSSVLVMLASAASGYGPPFLKVAPSLAFTPWSTIQNHVAEIPALVQPAVLLMIVAWALAGTATSLVARRGGRSAGIAAMIVGLLALAVSYGLWAAATGFLWPTDEVLTQLGFAAFVAVAVAMVDRAPRGREAPDVVFGEEVETEAEA